MSRSRVIFIWLLFVGVCVTLIARATFNADMSAFLPRTPTVNQQIMVEQLKDGAVSRLILVGIDGVQPSELAQISKSMAVQLRKLPELASVNNGERNGVESDFQLLWKNRYLLSDNVTAQHFTAEGLHDSLLMYLDLLGTPMGSMAQRVLPEDPGGELIHLLEQLSGATPPAMQDDVWFSRDGKRAILLVQTQGSGADIDAQERAMQHIQHVFDAVKLPGAKLQMTGPGVFSVQSRASIRDDAYRLSLIAMLLVMSLLLLLYRSFYVLALGLIPVVTGALAGVAAVSLGFGSVHGITLGFGITLIGEGVDYAIYLFTQIEEKTTPQTTLQRIWPTLRLGLLTSISGFSAMLFSGFTGLAQLGLFSIAGLLAAAITTRHVLPSLLPAGFSVPGLTHLSRRLNGLVNQAPRARMILLVLVVLATILLFLRRDELWNDNLSSMSPVAPQLLQLDQQLRDDMGVSDVRYMLVLQAPDQEGVLQSGEVMASALQGQVKDGQLAGFDAPVLPSRKLQLSRQGALPEPAVLKNNLTVALRELPYRSEIFAPFFGQIAEAKKQAILDRADLKGSNLGLKLDAQLMQTGNGWQLILPLRGVKDADILTRNLHHLTATPFILLDMKRESEMMLHDYRQQAMSYSLLGVLIIFALLFVSLKSARRVFNVSLPLIASVIVVTATLVLTGHPLSIFHLVGLLLVVAVGSNYALFFDHGGDTEERRERTMSSVLFANLSTVIAFGLLAFSQSPVLNAIGFTVAAGSFFSLIFSAICIVDSRVYKEVC